MAYKDVLVHVATRYEEREGAGTYVEGVTSKLEDVVAQTFACCLFLPMGTEDQGSSRGGRTVKRPTLLLSVLDHLGAPVVVPAKARLGIVAAELNEAEGLPADTEVRWQVDGTAQPFGKPGRAIVGKQVTLLRVED